MGGKGGGRECSTKQKKTPTSPALFILEGFSLPSVNTGVVEPEGDEMPWGKTGSVMKCIWYHLAVFFVIYIVDNRK